MTVDQLSMDLTRELADNDADERQASGPVDPRAIPSRFSLLSKMALSAAHYHEACQQPQDHSLAAKFGKLAGAQNDPSAALRFGTAVHSLLLGNGRDEITVFSGKVRNGKLWMDFQQKAGDAGFKVILNQREYEHARAVADAILRHSRACDLLFGPDVVREARIDWQWNGKAFRSTPDARSKSRSFVVDLKTTSAQGLNAFSWHAAKYSYHAQMALYRRAILAAEGWSPRDAIIVSVDKPRPHLVTVRPLEQADLLAGEKRLRLWLEALLECERSNYWGGYAESDVPLRIPNAEEDGMPDLDFGDGDAA
jgi:hypothetical protein